MVATQDNVWFPLRTMCRLQTGQCVVSKQDNVCFPNRTMCAVQQRQCVVPKQENREDASDFDDFLTKTIGAASKKIVRPNGFSDTRIREAGGRGGSAPPNPPALLLSNAFCLTFALFSSPPWKLSLSPSDRARRCDLDAPIESCGAQTYAPVRADHVESPYDIFCHLTYM